MRGTSAYAHSADRLKPEMTQKILSVDDSKTVRRMLARGASSDAARWLANSENAIEVGGVNLSDKEDVLASVLLDLTQTATQRASLNIANRVLEKFNSIGVLHKDSVQSAGFIVLKAPDIPSILIETAYISNQSEEHNLNSQLYQHKIAEAILSGVVNYFKKMPTVESKIATL